MSGISFTVLLLFLLQLNLRKVQALKCDAVSKEDQEAYLQCILRPYEQEMQEKMKVCWDEVYKEACGNVEGDCCLCPTNLCEITLCLYEQMEEQKVKEIAERAKLCYTERYEKNEAETQGCMSNKIMEMPGGMELAQSLQDCYIEDFNALSSDDPKVKCSATVNFGSCAKKHDIKDEQMEQVNEAFLACSKEQRKDPSEFTQI